MRKSFRKVLSTALACTLALAATITMMPAISSAADIQKGVKVDKKVDLDNPDYNVYFAFQTDPNYSFRNAWFDTYGKYDKKNPFFDQITGWDDNNEAVKLDGTFTDAHITGNGTYTVGVSGLNNSLETQKAFRLLFMSTDIPASAKDTIKFSDIKVSIDGIEKISNCEEFLDPDSLKKPKCLDVDIINVYNETIKELYTDTQIPTDSCTITFTISGFNKDNPDAVATTPTPASANSDATVTSDADADSTSSSPIVPIVVVIVVVVVVVVVVVAKKKKK